MIEEQVKVTGKVSIKVFDATGNLKEDVNIANLVVTGGKEFIASRMVGTSAAAMSHMAVGSGTTAAAAGQTALVSELGRASLTSGAASGAVTTYIATFGAGTGTGAVTEAGIFNDGTTGTMLCRTVFSVVNKGANDSMTITWTITVS